MNNNFTVVSYYTVGTEYEKIIKNLIKSIEIFKLPYKIYSKPNLGSWEKNTQQKAIVIKESLEELNTNIVWVDADAIFQKHPDYFYSISEDIDISAHYLSTKYNPHELLTGTIYFKNNKMCKKIIEDWIILNTTNKNWDQKNLQKILENYTNIKIEQLPKEYIKINLNQFQEYIKEEDVVIKHYQASRLYRRNVR